MVKHRFTVPIGYCPVCKANQFFHNSVGFSGKCPICKTFIANIFARTTEEATQIGEKSLDLAGEQCDDGQVVAAEKQRKTCIHTVPYDEPCEACSSLD